MLMRSGRSWSLLITFLAQLSLMGSRSKTTTSTWKCLLLIWSSALGSTLTGEQWTKKNGSGWAWGLAQSGLEHCEGTLFSNLIFEIKLQRQSEIFYIIPSVSIAQKSARKVGSWLMTMLGYPNGVRESQWWLQTLFTSMNCLKSGILAMRKGGSLSLSGCRPFEQSCRAGKEL